MVQAKRRLRVNKLDIRKIPKTKRVAAENCSKNETPKAAVKTESLPATRDEIERTNLVNETPRDNNVSPYESANGCNEEVKQNDIQEKEEKIDCVESGDEFTEISGASEKADVQEKEKKKECVEFGNDCTEISDASEKADDWNQYEENKKNVGSCLEKQGSPTVDNEATGENASISLETLSSDFSVQEKETLEKGEDQYWLVNLIASLNFAENLSNCFHTVDTFCLGTQNLARNVPFECKEEIFLTLADTIDRSPCNPTKLREHAAASRAACYDSIGDDEILDEAADDNTSFCRTESAGYESVSKDSSIKSVDWKEAEAELQSTSSHSRLQSSRLQSDASIETENSQFAC